MDDNTEEFLKALSCLSRKYKIMIGGCGCCSSPWLADMDEEDLKIDKRYTYEDMLEWN